MKNLIKVVFISVILLVIVACSMPVTRVDVQSFEIKKAGIQEEQVLSKLTGILIDRGFDVKFTNKDAGVLTTEYKKFASFGIDPPFDFYMQIKGRVKIAQDEASITLSPIVKEQNRRNAAAFTEHELSYYVGNPTDIGLINSMKAGVGWRPLGQTLFMNVVTDTAEAFGLSVSDVIQNVTKTPANAFLVN